MSKHIDTTLEPVNADNWRNVTRLEVTPDQKTFVAAPAYYLAYCAYSEDGWKPLAIYRGTEIIGFMMWDIDPSDGACWLGGILIDHRQQGKGYGRQAVAAAIKMLNQQHGLTDFALSYEPDNKVARHLYLDMGFHETGEKEGNEQVARYRLTSS